MNQLPKYLNSNIFRRAWVYLKNQAKSTLYKIIEKKILKIIFSSNIYKAPNRSECMLNFWISSDELHLEWTMLYVQTQKYPVQHTELASNGISGTSLSWSFSRYLLYTEVILALVARGPTIYRKHRNNTLNVTATNTFYFLKYRDDND